MLSCCRDGQELKKSPVGLVGEIKGDTQELDAGCSGSHVRACRIAACTPAVKGPKKLALGPRIDSPRPKFQNRADAGGWLKPAGCRLLRLACKGPEKLAVGSIGHSLRRMPEARNPAACNPVCWMQAAMDCKLQTRENSCTVLVSQRLCPACHSTRSFAQLWAVQAS